MAEYCCSDCGYRGHYSEFKQHMTDDERDHEIELQDSEEDDSDSLECPECGCESAWET